MKMEIIGKAKEVLQRFECRPVGTEGQLYRKSFQIQSCFRKYQVLNVLSEVQKEGRARLSIMSSRMLFKVAGPNYPS